jgi:hypothetical protein
VKGDEGAIQERLDLAREIGDRVAPIGWAGSRGIAVRQNNSKSEDPTILLESSHSPMLGKPHLWARVSDKAVAGTMLSLLFEEWCRSIFAGRRTN